MRISKVFFGLVLILFLSSQACDDRQDYFYNQSEKPDIGFVKDGNVLDEMNDSVKLGYSDMYFDYQISGGEVDSFMIKYIKGGGLLKNNHHNYTLKVEPDVLGYNEIKVVCSNVYGKSDVTKLNLYVFENLNPVVRFTVSEVSDKTIRIDCEDSFDKDKNFGGEIEKYQYQFGSEDIVTSVSSVRRQLSSGGTFNIRCRVCDNDGKWSKWKEKTIEIK